MKVVFRVMYRIKKERENLRVLREFQFIHNYCNKKKHVKTYQITLNYHIRVVGGVSAAKVRESF